MATGGEAGKDSGLPLGAGLVLPFLAGGRLVGDPIPTWNAEGLSAKLSAGPIILIGLLPIATRLARPRPPLSPRTCAEKGLPGRSAKHALAAVPTSDACGQVTAHDIPRDEDPDGGGRRRRGPGHGGASQMPKPARAEHDD